MLEFLRIVRHREKILIFLLHIAYKNYSQFSGRFSDNVSYRLP